MRDGGPWRVVGVSLRGSSHLKTNQACQDYHAFERLPDGTLLAVVADGAGAAALAEVGAEIAVKTTVETLKSRLESGGFSHTMEEQWQGLLHEAMSAALDAVEQEAASRNAPARELACTLSVVVARPAMVAAAQIGDGAVVVADGEGTILALLRPVSGEYLNETTFLVSSGALDQIQYAWREGGVSRLALMTDGLQMLALKSANGEPHAPFFAPLFAFIAAAEDEGQGRASLESFLGSDRVQSRADDDLTLLLAAVVP